jgi:class 3 adenylate cyclase
MRGEVRMPDAKIDLSKVPLFAGVDTSTFGSDATDWLCFYYDGQNVCVEGEPADSMIVILHGEVAILSQDTFLVTRRAPDVLGEQGFLAEDACRTASAVARGTVKVLRIPQTEIERLQSRSPQFTRNLLKIVSAKLAESTSERAFRYRNEHRLIAAFNSHLAPDITSKLLASGDDYGHPRLIQGIVLFADVRGFTASSLRLSPTELATQLGEYLDEMVRILLKHHAYVDKFIGDAVMAVWGFPFQSENSASEALLCAKQMVARAAEMMLGGDWIRIGVGMSAGSFFCGNIGSDLKRQFTVLGPAVNLAARCESACRDMGASVVISEDVYSQLDATEKSQLLARPNVSLKGIGEVCLYTIGNEGAGARPKSEGAHDELELQHEC